MATKKSKVLRASAILTGSAVASTSFSLDTTIGSKCSIVLDVTIGSLSLVTFAFQVSSDDSTYTPYMLESGFSSVNIDATGTLSVTVHAPGWKYLQVTALGTGTATNSTATITARYV